jgi:uncharacterized membrane protein
MVMALLIFKLYASGISTVLYSLLLRHHRASPSASLDKSVIKLTITLSIYEWVVKELSETF